MAEGITPHGRYFQSAISDSPPGRDRRLAQQAASQGFVIYPLPAFVMFVATLLTLSFIILILAIVVGLHVGDSLLHPNPLATYGGVWPGQSQPSVAAYARRLPQGRISCITGASPRQQYIGLDVRVAAGAYDALGRKISCMNKLDDGVFRWMTVAIDGNHVRELRLFSDTLPQDALLLYWGPPDSISRLGTDSLLNLYWEHSTYSAMAAVRESDSVVKLITLTARE